MSKKSLMFIVICFTTLVAGCQPNPVRLDSTYQPRDNRQVINHSESNHSPANTVNAEPTNAAPVNSNSMNANTSMMNANMTKPSEMKTESRTNSGK